MPEHNTPDRGELRAELRRYSVAQREVAEALGVSDTTVSLWLKGEVSSPMLDKAIPAYVAGLKRSAA